MSKIAKALKAIGLIIRNPFLLNRVLQDPDIWKAHIMNKYGLGNGLPVVDPSLLFGDGFETKVPLFTFLDGGSLVTDVALLRNLAGQFENCSFFEIGTWRGEMVYNLVDCANELYTLNLSDEEMRSLNIDERIIGQQGLFSRDMEKIIHIKANSRSFDFGGINRKFDLVFIDGSHHYDDVKADTENVFTHLIHDKSVVVWHDYTVNSEDLRFEVFAAILDGVPREFHNRLSHIAHTKSAMFYPGKLETYPHESPVTPKHFYSVSIKYKSFEKE